MPKSEQNSALERVSLKLNVHANWFFELFTLMPMGRIGYFEKISGFKCTVELNIYVRLISG